MTAGNDDRGLETPLEDLVEQLTPVEDDPETVPGDAAEADEADVWEQAIPVPTEEDHPSGSSQ